MTAQLLIFGILGIGDHGGRLLREPPPLHRRQRRRPRHRCSRAPTTWSALISIVLGWYFNVRYTHTYHDANYWNYTKMLFTNWAADSAAQDYVIVNLVLMPLWTIVDGTRRGLKWAWIFFVMSLFTSLAFVHRDLPGLHGAPVRYNKALAQERAVPRHPRRSHTLQDRVARVVAGDERDARARRGTRRRTDTDPSTGTGLSGHPARPGPERPHELGLEQPVGEVAARAAEHQLVGEGRVVQLALDQVGEVRRHRRDLGHDALGHLVAQAVLRLPVAATGR